MIVLVGESGSGKSTLGKSIIRLAPIQSGEIFFDNEPIHNLSNRAFFPYRKKIQMVFQDPSDSFSPKMKIKDILAEPLIINRNLSKSEVFRIVKQKSSNF